MAQFQTIKKCLGRNAQVKKIISQKVLRACRSKGALMLLWTSADSI